MINCPYCSIEFVIKNNLIKKTCPCDEDERVISLIEWYKIVFKIDIENGPVM